MAKPADSTDTHKPFRIIAQSPDEVYFLAQDTNKLVYIFDVSHRVGMPYWIAKAMGEVWGFSANRELLEQGKTKFKITGVKLSRQVLDWLDHDDVELLVQQLEAPFYDENKTEEEYDADMDLPHDLGELESGDDLDEGEE